MSMVGMAVGLGAIWRFPMIVAQKVSDAIRGIRVMDNGERLPITASIGVATFPTHGATAESLFASADWALYEAKRRGKDTVCNKMEYA